MPSNDIHDQSPPQPTIDIDFLMQPVRSERSNKLWSAAQSTMHDYQEQYPGRFAGGTIFGSVVSGKASISNSAKGGKPSDIDGWVYVHTDGDTSDHDFGSITWDKEHGVYKFDESRHINEAVAADIYRAAGLPYDEIRRLVREDRVDVRVVPINTRFIHDSVAVYAEYYRERVKLIAEFNTKRRDYIMGVSNERPEPPDPGDRSFPRELSGLFHPDLTGTLHGWRSVLLHELLAYPDIADDMWRNCVRSTVIGFERGHGRAELLPMTAQGALDLF